ncbi:MAG: hypothetical protein D6728_08950 [Cyanobacteria bacterium J055]|nr:MAG: hypothetical protein D6728_08950 [Cyanobacteria bacterium J055]
MTPEEIETVLKAAFDRCRDQGCPLDERQQQILLAAIRADNTPPADDPNPLDELTPEELRSFLEFVKDQERQNRSWKVTLLEDWLQGRDSGAVQFVRDRYGTAWLNRVQPFHLEAYEDMLEEGILGIEVGDHLEVSNRLWEWVQNDEPSSQEWIACTVIGIYEAEADDTKYTNCLIRFENGTEYEIQGIYQWNRYNWRRMR